MIFSRFLSVFGLIGAVSIGAITSCSDGAPTDPMATAGQGGTPTIGSVDNPGAAGQPAAVSGGAGAAGSPVAVAGTGGVTGAAGSAGAIAGSGGVSAGSGATAGSGGASAAAGAGGQAASSAAGSGGTGGAVAGAGGQMSDAGAPEEDDPFGGIFGPAPISCDGMLCLEDADCATLYPDETAACKFTKCVDLLCE